MSDSLRDAASEFLELTEDFPDATHAEMFLDVKSLRAICTAFLAKVVCRDCGGSGRRWYALYGMGTCERCKGTGEAR